MDGDDPTLSDVKSTVENKDAEVPLASPRSAANEESAIVPVGADEALNHEPVQLGENLPFYKQKWFRIIAVRVAIRAAGIALLIGLSFAFSYKSVVHKYSAWIHGIHPAAASIAVYTSLASVFVAIMPGSYAPIVLAGATYGVWLGWLVGYITMNLGAAMNWMWIRCAHSFTDRVVPGAR